MEIFKITSRISGAVLFELEAETLRQCLEAAVGCGVSLRGAALCGFDLRGFDLRGCDLRGADLRGSDLRGADLYGADSRGADLRAADLRAADLRAANLRVADLRGSDLRGADLYGADLRGADLGGADLGGADLGGANLYSDANATLAIAQTRILPAGDIIGWKKCNGGVIAKLRIPAEARRSHAFGRKCRAEYADVLEVIGSDRGITDYHGLRTVYCAGERVTADRFSEDWQKECAPGIHFFITREEAEAY